MPFIIPNATDTTSGNRYAALDQAEPDSLDFELLGKASSGVINGCEVVATSPASSSVSVTSGQLLLNNFAYSLTGQTLALNTAPATNRFDLVVARVAANATTASLLVISGAESATNPTYPKSRSRLLPNELSADPSALNHINPDTDVVLAAVYRNGGSSVASANIVDKRISVRSNIPFQGTGVPSNSVGVAGDLYYRSANQVSSGVYVKNAADTWDELAKYPLDPGIPVGGLILWPAVSNPNPLVWVEADGSAVSRTGYATLFSVLGTTYGAGDGASTFNLPDFRGHYLAGLPSTGGATLGTRVGNANNTVTLTTAQLPVHNHAVDSGVTVSTVSGHDHTVALQTSGGVTSPESNTHTHPFSGTTSSTAVTTNQNIGQILGTSAGYTTSTNLNAVASSANNIPHDHTFSGTTSANSHGHVHALPALTVSGNTAQNGEHGHILSGNTGNTGDGAAVDITPSTFYMRFFLRYA